MPLPTMPVGPLDGREFASWLDGVAADLEDTALRRMVEVLREHWYYEVVEYDLEKVMATLVPEPHYVLYGPMHRMELHGQQAVRELYQAQFGGGPTAMSMEIDHFALGASSIAFEGRGVMPLDAGLGRGMAATIPGVDLDRPGHLRLPTAIFIPFEGDLMGGEINYFDVPPGLHHITYLDDE